MALDSKKLLELRSKRQEGQGYQVKKPAPQSTAQAGHKVIDRRTAVRGENPAQRRARKVQEAREFAQRIQPLKDKASKIGNYYSGEDRRRYENYDVETSKAELERLDSTADQVRGIQNRLDLMFATGVGRDQELNLRQQMANLLADYGGDLSKLDQARNELRKTQSGAERYQSAKALIDVDDPQFAALSGVDSSVMDTRYRWINDPAYRAEYAQLLTKGSAGGTAPVNNYEEASLDLMTDEERRTYNYHYAKGGPEQADQYLKAIQGKLNERRAKEIYADVDVFDDGWADLITKYAFGLEAGVDQWQSGMKGFLEQEGHYVPDSARAQASGMVRESLAGTGPKLPQWLGGGSLGQMGYDAVTTSANMAPSILASTLLNVALPGAGSYAGTALMSMSAAGNARQEKLNEGYTDEQASAYGMLVGASEAIMERLVGGIGKLGGQGLGGLTDKLTSGKFTAFLNNLDSAFLRASVELGESMISEGTEEYLQEVLDPLFRNWTLGEDNDIDLLSPDALYSAVLGAITGGVMEGPGIIKNGLVQGTQDAQADAEDFSVVPGAEVAAVPAVGTVFKTETVGASAAPSPAVGAAGIEASDAIDGTAEEIRAVTDNPDLAQAAKKYGRQAQALVDAYNLGTELDVESFDREFRIAFDQGKNGVDQAYTVNQNKQVQHLSELQRIAAWNAGRAAGGISLLNKKGTDASAVERVKVKGIAQTEDGLGLELEDGRLVGIGEINLPTASENAAVKGIVELGVGADDANGLYERFRNGNVRGDVFAKGIAEAFRSGGYSIPMAEMARAGSATAALSEQQRKAAYDLGKKYAQAAAAQAKTPARGAAGLGKVHYDGDMSKLNERQKASVAALETVAQALGVQIHLFESEVMDNGLRDKPNGWYDTSTGEIHIDLHAGISGEDTVLFTAAHELTHFIRQWSPAKFKMLADFLVEQYGEHGVKVETLVERQQAKAKRTGRELNYDDAFEEMVADSMETMLADGQAVQKLSELAQRDKTLVRKMKEKMAELARKLRKAYQGLLPDSAEGRKVAEMADAAQKLQELFVEALEDAGRAYQAKDEDQGEVEVPVADWSDFDESSIAFSFGGEGAKYADAAALAKAQKMKASGASAKTIFRQTGWYQGADGKWRFEIDDSKMRYDKTGNLRGAVDVSERTKDAGPARRALEQAADYETLEKVRAYDTALILKNEARQKELYEELSAGEFGEAFRRYATAKGAVWRAHSGIGGRLADYIDHPALFEQYPALRNMELQFQDLSEEGCEGYFDGRGIVVDESLRDAPESTLLHEIQHAVQDIEGFAEGSNKKYWAGVQEGDRAMMKSPEGSKLARKRTRKMLRELPGAVARSDGEAAVEELSAAEFAARKLADGTDDRRDPYELYLNTAGEIEARDVSRRRNMSAEVRKKRLPDTGDGNTVFVERQKNKKNARMGGVKYSQRYQAADENPDILAMVNKVTSGEFKPNEKVYLGTVSDATAEQIHELTGIRVNGFKVAIEARQIDHILKGHGVRGDTDHSMANSGDIAKMEYVLNAPDDIRKAGKTQAYLYMRGGKNRHADTVLYEKNIGAKSYYVVQAVPDTKAKTLFIVTAFIGNSGYKKEAPQLINAQGPDATAKTEVADASNVRVAQNEPKVNSKFSLRQPVEETGTLIAMHNLTAEKLEKAIGLGGFPMPSIAVTKADIPHTNFGDITLVMDKRTIDPKADRRNTVYSADAWTPTFPRTEYEANPVVKGRVRRTLEGLKGKIVPQFQGDLRRVQYGLEDLLNSQDGEENLIRHVMDNYGLKAAYLESQGKHIDEIQVEREIPKRYNDAARAKYETIIEALGTRDAAQIGKMPLKDIRDNYGPVLEQIVPGISKTALRLSRFMQQTIDYLMDDGSGPATETVVDHAATKRAVDGALDQAGYEAWVRELFSGIEGDRGIYNGKERFTPSGRSRSFQQTHLPVTLDNIVKAMAAQNGGNIKNVSGFNGVKTLRAGTAQRFKSIQGMHDMEGRLRNLTEEQQTELTDALNSRLYDLIDEIDQEAGRAGTSNNLIRFDRIGQIIMEASETGRYNVADIQKVFRENYQTISDELALKVKELLFDVSQMPVNLFEAKPRRAVRFDEVMAAVVPSDTGENLRIRLEESGVRVIEYAAGDNQDRLAKVNSIDGAKFSERDPAAEKLNRALEKENKAQAEEIKYLREMLRLQHKVTDGAKFTRSSVNELAGMLMKEAGAKGDRKELAAALNDLYERIATIDDPLGLTWGDIDELIDGAAKWLADHAEVKSDRGEYADDILKELRTMRISLNEGQMAEVSSRYGSYNDFRKATFGSFILARDGTPLDVVWQDLADQYPGTFDSNASDADMPLWLAEIVESLRDADLAAEEAAYQREDLLKQMRQAVYDGYWKVSRLRTVSDIWKDRMEKLNKAAREELQKEADAIQKQMDRVALGHDKTAEQMTSAWSEMDALEREHTQILRQLRKEKQEAVKNAQAETAERYRDARKKAVEGRNKTTARHRIEKTVKELEKLLLKGDKKTHVKEGMRNFVEEALTSATVLFADTYSDEELVLGGIYTDLTPEENRLIDETRHLLGQKKDLLSDSAIAAESEAVAAGDTSGFDQRMKQVQKLDRQISANMGKLHGVLVRERARLNRATVGGVLANLSAAYRSLGQSDDLYIRGAAREEVWQHLDSLAETIGGATAGDLTLAQLTEINKAFRMVLHTVRSANKLFAEGQKESLVEVVKAAIQEITSNGRNSKLGVKLVEELKKFGFNNLKPVYFFEHLGSRVMRGLYKGLLNGQSDWARDVDEARAYFRSTADRAGLDSWDMEKTHTFRAASGDEFRLNLQQMMSLYAYSRRDQARDHIRKGGIVIDSDTDIQEVVEIGGKLKVKLKGKSTDATAYNIDDVTLGEIVGKLTKEQKTFVEEMQSYLSDVMGGKGNEVSMTLYGVKLFTEQNYLPIRSAHQYMVRAKEQAEQTAKVKNAGFTKSTVAHASNPVVLTPFLDIWSDHVNEMSLYHAMTLPLEDLHRVYTFSQTGDGGRGSQSVTAAIENAFGAQATGYIDQLMKDLNGGARVDSATGLINKSIALFKKGSTFLSASVVIQQPSAIVRATALVDSKYFQWAKLPVKWALDLTARRKQHDRLWAECKKYAPIALIKEMGYFDTSVGRTTRDFIQAKEYSGWSEKAKGVIHDSGYRDEVFSRAPALADELAWCSIWEAVKREQHDKHPKLRVGSEEFLKLCGERFTEVIDKTQVYDSVLARSANMRSKDTGMKMATSFMAEPTVSANMMADALLKGKRGDRKFARRAIGSVISSGILNAMLYSLVAAARDDDEDKEYWERYLGSVTGEVFEVLNPLTYLPFGRDIVSLVQGYDVERSDMAIVSDLVNALRKADNEDLSGVERVEDLIATVLKLFGLPAGNVWRDAKALYNVFKNDIDGQGSTAAGIGYAVMENLPFGKAASNGQQLYEATIKGDQEHAQRVRARFDDENAAQTALRKALRENDPRIREAAVAWNEGQLEEYMALAKEVIAEKHFSQDDVIMAIRAEAESLVPDEEAEAAVTRHKGLFTTAAFAVAASDGDSTMMKAIREDLIQSAVSNGRSRAEAEKAVDGSIRSELKDCVLGGLLSAQKARAALERCCGVDADEAGELISQWGFEEEHGYKWSERMERFTEAAVDGTGSAGRIREDVIVAGVAGGKTQEEAEEDFESSFRSSLRDLYDAEGVSDAKAEGLLKQYGGRSAEEAQGDIRYWSFTRDNPDVNVEKAWINEYYDEVASSGLNIEIFVDYRNRVKSITGLGKKAERMKVIDSLPISDAQKDALYYAEGWAKSTIQEAPWH